MNFDMSKVTTNIARVKHKALAKFGTAEVTTDLTYEEAKTHFQEFQNNMKKLNKDATKLMQIFQEVQLQVTKITEDLHKISDENAVIEQETEVALQIAKSVEAYDLTMKEDFIGALSKYLGQFGELENRIKTHSLVKLDMDRYQHEVKTGHKVAQAEPKLKAKQEQYQALNTELMQDFDALFEDRTYVLDPTLATYLKSTCDFFTEAAKISERTKNLASSYDRAAVHEHPRVITSMDQSSQTSIGSPKTLSPATSPKSSEPLPSVPSKQKKAKAVFDFATQDASELGFKTGDIVIIHSTEGEWWTGELNGQRGLLPANYVQLI